MTFKWICGVCHKSLSSKQMVVNHLMKLHPTADNKNFTRIRTADEDYDNNKQSYERMKPTKKTAYSSFSKLHNIFSNENLYEKLELYPKKLKDPGNEYVVDREDADDIEPRNEDSEYLNDNTDDNFQIGDDGIGDSLNTITGSYQNLSISPPSPPFQVDDLLSTGNGFSSNLTFVSDSNSQVLSYNEENTEIDISVSNHAGGISDSDVNSLRPTKAVKDVFQTPFKVRGKCGCVKCSTDPCGSCYNCLHKEAK